MNAESIAQVCHEANRALQRLNGEIVNFPWESTSQSMRDSVVSGVHGVLDGNTPEQSHQSWLDFKGAEGWGYGETKDFTAKTHPCFVPYDQLPPDQKVKDSLFSSIVLALREATP